MPGSMFMNNAARIQGKRKKFEHGRRIIFDAGKKFNLPNKQSGFHEIAETLIHPALNVQQASHRLSRKPEGLYHGGLSPGGIADKCFFLPMGSPMKNQRKPAAPPGSSASLAPEQQLFKEEKRLAEAVLRRTRLLEKIASRRKEARKSGADPDLEKALWKVWEDALNREGVSRHRLWHALLAQANSLAYAQADRDTSAERKSWSLAPRAATNPVQLNGPADVFTSRILTFWAAAANLPTTLPNPALNDELIELIKALNQTGAGLSWDGDAVTHGRGRTPALELEQKTIHVGRHRSTLALMIALALGRPGVVKFSAAGELNMLSLKSWQGQCNTLGARLHQLNPHAPGLPVRLESSGQIRQAHVGPETPEELIWALSAAAPFFPEGLCLTWPERFIPGQGHESIMHLLRTASVQVTQLDSGVQIPPGKPIIAPEPRIPLDPALCCLLLAWPRFSNRPMRVLGSWPDNAPHARRYTDILEACGLCIELDSRSATSKPGGWPAGAQLDVRGLPQALPLAAILALSAPHGLTVISDRDLMGMEVLNRLLDFTGRTVEGEGQRFSFRPSGKSPDKDIPDLEAPDAFWGMAMALLSFAHPGLPLANPGELTTLWPQFWRIFQGVLSVSKPKPEGRPTEATDALPGRQRKRIRI